MLIHAEDLIIGMKLESEIGLKAGSYLITPKEVPGGLTESTIKSIRNFSHQFVPYEHLVDIGEDELTLRHLKKTLENDVQKILTSIESGKDVPNFVQNFDIREKMLRVMDKILLMPDITKQLYNFKNMTRSSGSKSQLLMDHSVRVALLAIALGLKQRLSIISLINVGIAALLHDTGILRCELYRDFNQIEEMTDIEIQQFVSEHQENSVNLFSEKKIIMSENNRKEILNIIGSHHHLDMTRQPARSPLAIFYLAELVDEMVAPLPHRLRYDFSPLELEILGDKYRGQTGLVSVLLGLIKLHKKNENAWKLVESLCELFNMREMMVENYDDKLRKILDICPFGKKRPYPSLSGNSLPRTVYCFNEEKDFSCEHLSQQQISIQLPNGKMSDFFKCRTLSNGLNDLNKDSRGE